MKKNLWLWLCLLGLVGYVGLAFLFPRYDASARWQLRHHRDFFVTQARTFAAQQGIQTANWTVVVSPERARNTERYLDHQNQAAIPATEKTLLTRLPVRVRFLAPGGAGNLNFVFTSEGQLLDYTRTGVTAPAPAAQDLPTTALADKILAENFSQVKNEFRFENESTPEKDSKKYHWSYHSTADQELSITTEILLSGTQLISIRCKPTLPPLYSEELSRRNLPTFALALAANFISNVVGVLLALVIFFLCLTRKEIDLRTTLRFFLGLTITTLLIFYLQDLLGDLMVGAFINITNPNILRGLAYGLFFIICFGYALIVTAFWASGESISARYHAGRDAIFSAFVRGNFRARVVAQNILAGVLMGGIIAFIPYGVARLFNSARPPTEIVGLDDYLLTKLPLIHVFVESVINNDSNTYFLLLIFGFLAPLLGAYVRKYWLQQFLLIAVSLFFLNDLNPNQTTSISLKFFTTGLIVAVYFLLYKQFDLLAVLTASTAAGILLKGYSFSLQPAASLLQTGRMIFIIYGALVCLTLLLLKISPDEMIAQRVVENVFDDEGERDRLKASFEVARKAQEKMLPAAPPQIQGLNIAALCRPARECGGDLYDFLELPDGKLGVVVADVSGKGVPAALYMTLTKGLLASVAEETSDPGEILRTVNQHLYEVCKRKMFVTLFLGVIDPTTKIMAYARAGHNPPVFRRRATQTTKLLKPGGLGLGLNAGKSFDRLLKVEQIQLQANDALVLYSDGITEAMNDQKEEYGEDRLMEVMAQTDALEVGETLTTVITDVSQFLGKTPPQDDQTVVVIQIK